MRTRRATEKGRGDEIKRFQKMILHTQNTVYHKTKPNSLLKTEIKTRNSSVFSETQKSKPSPSPKIKIQNLDEKEVSNQRCHSHAISLTQWPSIHQTNSTSTLLLLQKKTLNKPQTTTLLLLPRPLDRLGEEEQEEPTDEASDQPSVTTINSNAKYSEDSKSTIAAACRGCC